MCIYVLSIPFAVTSSAFTVTETEQQSIAPSRVNSSCTIPSSSSKVYEADANASDTSIKISKAITTHAIASIYYYYTSSNDVANSCITVPTYIVNNDITLPLATLRLLLLLLVNFD